MHVVVVWKKFEDSLAGADCAGGYGASGLGGVEPSISAWASTRVRQRFSSRSWCIQAGSLSARELSRPLMRQGPA